MDEYDYEEDQWTISKEEYEKMMRADAEAAERAYEYYETHGETYQETRWREIMNDCYPDGVDEDGVPLEFSSDMDW